MATKLTAVNNYTPYAFQLHNWIAGGTTPQDNVPIPPNQTTKTGGKDDDYILIPNADPVLKFFCLDNMAFTSSQVNIFMWQIGDVAYWTQNAPPNPNFLGNQIANSGDNDSVTMTIAKDVNNNITVTMQATSQSATA
jgi:hypothetical protein